MNMAPAIGLAITQPSGLGPALLTAAERELGVAITERAWSRACTRLSGNDTPGAWFDAARDVLSLELTPMPRTTALIAGTYVVRRQQYWSTITVEGTAGDAPLAGDFDEAYRAVRRYRHARLTFATFRRLLGENGRILSRIMWTSLMVNLLALSVPLYMNAVYDRVLPAHAQASLWTLSVGVALAIVLELVLRSERVNALVGIANVVQSAVEPDVVARLVRRDIRHSPDAPLSGSEHVQALGHWERLRTHYWQIVSGPVIDSAFIVVYLAVIAWIGGLLALVVLLGLGAAAWVVMQADRQLRDSRDGDAETFRVTPADVVNYKTSNAEAALINQYLLHSESARQREQARFRILQRCTSRLSAVANLQTALVVVTAFYLIGAQLMSPAGIFATVLLGARALQPIAGWTSALPAIRQVRAAMRRLDEQLEQAPDGERPPHGSGAETGWAAEDLQVGYSPTSMVLRGLNLRIQAGERIAIVGAEGSGKTTLLRALMGMVPVRAGSLCHDGSPLWKEAAAVRSRTHFAWQGAEPLGRTLRDHLELEGTLPDDEILDKARQAGLMPLLSALPAGLDTAWSAVRPVERQKVREKIALWRLLLSRKPVLVLDEPSECLDQHLETVLLQHLARQRDEPTTLLIATGRSRLLEVVDRVILLQRGRIAFDGPTHIFVSGNAS